MKTISISIPTYNEENNVLPLYDALHEQLMALKDRYNYEIVFIDNKSTDSTREKILLLCAKDPCVKAIFNRRNFGHGNSSFYGTLQTTGDCTICYSADFQDPPELLPRMIEAWEQGHKIVCMVKTQSDENKAARAVRTLYYRMLRRLSNSTEIIEHFTGFGLYDKSALDVARILDDPNPFTRGMTAEWGFDMIEIPYTQATRRTGKSGNNFFSLYDVAMQGITAHTKTGPRLATLLGVIMAGASAVAALVCLILKLATGAAFSMGHAALAAGMFFMGGVQLFFLGIIGEYILDVRRRSTKNPLVFEERRVNFEEEVTKE